MSCEQFADGIAGDVPSAVGLIRMLLKDGDSESPVQLVNSILSRPTVQRSGNIFPRMTSFDAASGRNQQSAVRILTALVRKCTTLLLPKDGPDGRALLIEGMLESKTFREMSLPSQTMEKEMKYKHFSALPPVVAIADAMSSLGQQDEARRIELISLLGAYPKKWVRKLIPGAGKITVDNAERHTVAVGPGLADPQRRSTSRNRRVGSKEDHFQAWMKGHIIVMPDVHRDSTGSFVEEPINYLTLNRNQAFGSYQKDFAIARAGGRYGLSADDDSYSHVHFYKRCKEMNLREIPEEHGVCSTCNRNNTNWNSILHSIDILYASDDERRKLLKGKVEKLKNYFKSGGAFTVHLQRTSTCIHHCLQYALSDLDDADFQVRCTDHEHTHGDTMYEAAFDLFDELREQWRIIYNATDFSCTHDGDDSIAVWIRGGDAMIRDRDGEEFVVAWDEIEGISARRINILLLGDMIDTFEVRFTLHLCHLYSDRNQTHGENHIYAHTNCVMAADYMMKLRAKKFVSDTSEWHILLVQRVERPYCMSVSSAGRRDDITIAFIRQDKWCGLNKSRR